MTSTARRVDPVRQFATITLGSLLVVAGLILGLETLADVAFDASTLATAGLVFTGVCFVFAGSILVTGRRDEPQRLTAATWITISRGWALVGFAALSATEQGQWIAAGLFAVAAGLDAADGAVARRTDSVTELGGRLDVEIDSFTVLVGTLVVIDLGAVPAVFLAVGLVRYVFVAGVVVRRRLGHRVAALDPSPFRQLTGATIVVTIWIGLLPFPAEWVSQTLAWVVTGPILVHFLWDWAAVSGWRS